MNDNDIIKALERCIWSINSEHQLCPSCPYYERDCSEEVAKDALDLINHQKAEIERLKKIAADTAQRYLDKHAQYIDALSERDEIRTEAIKEFAERLKEKIHYSVRKYWNEGTGGYYLAEDVDLDIDVLAGEMTGEME